VHSVENECHCLKLIKAFGLLAANFAMAQFGDKKSLFVERFVRRWTSDVRLPQDCYRFGARSARVYDPKLIRARSDTVQGISGAELQAVTQPSLVAQRRARRCQK